LRVNPGLALEGPAVSARSRPAAGAATPLKVGVGVEPADGTVTDGSLPRTGTVERVETVDETVPESVWLPPDNPWAAGGIDGRGNGRTGGVIAGLTAGTTAEVTGSVVAATAPVTAGTTGRLELTGLSGEPVTMVADGMTLPGREAAEAGLARAVRRTKPTRIPAAPPSRMRAVRRSIPCDRDGLPEASSNTGSTISTG
jgi:hypothetical protein